MVLGSRNISLNSARQKNSFLWSLVSKLITPREAQIGMAFRSKHTGVLPDSSIAPSRFQLSALSTSSPNSPLFICTPASGSSYTSPKRRFIPGKTENGRVNGWLDAMKASSPPHSRYLKGDLKGDPFDKLNIEAVDVHYQAWIVKHPSALSKFDQIVEVANGKQIVVFLDYDGTLSPIVEDPESAFMSEAMRNAVRSLAMHFPTAIISGRCREKVYDFVRLAELYYAGSHGMDIMGPAEGCTGVTINGAKVLDAKGNEVVFFQPASEFISVIDEVFDILEGIVKRVNGAKVEHNKFCVTVHFRRVEEEDWVALAEKVQDVLQSFPSLCLTQGRKVLEIRPLTDWDKGKALEFLLNALGLGGRPDVFPIYIGDDRTDEDAFKVLNKKNHGLGILVSNVAKETDAMSSLRDPSEVLEFLQHLVNWRQRLNHWP